MDDLESLQQLRARVPAARDEELREHRERLLREAARQKMRLGWLRRLRRASSRLWIPAVAGVLTLTLLGAFGFLVRQAGPDTLTPPTPDQWIYTRTVEVTNSGKAVTERTWRSGDFGAIVVRKANGKVTRDRGDEVKQGTLGYFDSTKDLYTFYQSLLDHSGSGIATLNARVDRVAREHDMTPKNTSHREYRVSRIYWAYQLILAALDADPPRDVQNALYRVYRQYPGVKDDGVLRDAAGRKSIALGIPVLVLSPDFEATGVRAQLLFDPDTHAYRGWRTANTKTSRSTSQAVVSSGIVEHPGQVP